MFENINQYMYTVLNFFIKNDMYCICCPQKHKAIWPNKDDVCIRPGLQDPLTGLHQSPASAATLTTQ